MNREPSRPDQAHGATGRASTLDSPLAAGEELVLVRSGDWRILVPMRHVERIHGAALPAAVPAQAAACPPMVCIAGELVPVLFGEALFGAAGVTLAASDQMILLRAGDRRALLWVDAAEEVLPFEPLSGEAALPALASGFSGRERAYAVLDVPRLLDVSLAPGGGDRGGEGTS